METLNAIAGFVGLLLTVILGWRQLRGLFFGLTTKGKHLLLRLNERAENRTRLFLNHPSALMAYLVKSIGALVLLTLGLLVTWAYVRASLSPQGVRSFSSLFWWTLSLAWGTQGGLIWSQLENVLVAAAFTERERARSGKQEQPGPRRVA